MLRRQHLRSFKNQASAIVAIPDLKLLRVRHRQNSEREDFIYFGPVKQIAGAFGRDLRIVVQDDGRGQDQIPLSFLSRQDGPRSGIAARRCGGFQRFRRVQQRNEFTSRHFENAVNGNHRMQQHFVAICVAQVIQLRKVHRAER